MSYATLASLTDRYGLDPLVRLTDRAIPATGVVDEAVIDRALADADALIDGYLAARYVLPLSPVPSLIPPLAAAIAFWNLHAHEPDPKTKADHDAAIRTLKDIAAGTVRIPAAGVEPAQPAGSGARMTDRERPMTGDNMTGFV